MAARNSDLSSKVSELDLIIKQLDYWTTEQGKDFLVSLISRLEQFTRMERCELFRQYLSEPKFAGRLLEFARGDYKDVNMLINIVSAIGNMIERYGLPFSDEIFEFFVNLKDKKKIGYYVSMFIVKFPQFKELPSRWDYLISIPSIAPRSDSAKNFYAEIQRLIKENERIPTGYKEKIIEILGDLASKTKSKVMEDEYHRTIAVLLAS